MNPVFGVAAAVLIGLGHQCSPRADTLHFDAKKLFEQSVTEHLRLATNGSGLELESGELVEDDGPAAGHSYREPKNQEALAPGIWIKKELFISNPQARAAFLVLLSEGTFDVTINGMDQTLGPNQSGRHSYKTCAFDPAILKPGRNDIVLRGSGTVFIARDDEFPLGSRTRTRHPNRSAKSTDAGKSWDYDHLGPAGKLDGEYGIRVFLDHYRPHGVLTMPVVDIANLEGRAVAPTVSKIGPISIAVQADARVAGQVRVRARSGSSYAPSEENWSQWKELGERGGMMEKPTGRYVQIAVELSSAGGLESPRLTAVQVSATPAQPGDWTSRVTVREEHNQQIVRTSIPFQYEPLDHPSLRKLREQYKLDDLVRGAQSELDLLLRLAQWTCNYWDWPNHITEQYPPWDALEILKPHRDGTPVGGFCLQFNLVFLQACESFGFPGRMISISQGRLQEAHPGGGHEIVELWSNEWQKWAYVDGALAWYVVDQTTGVPLSMLELRERQLSLLAGKSTPAVRVIAAERTRNKQFLWNGLGGPEPLNWYSELRMIPRSNFLQEKSPLPLNQGTEEWCWTGHYVWSDERVPAGLLFDHRVFKQNDFEWTLNQAHFVLEPGLAAGSLRVHLDTETPSLETFLAEIDGGAKKRVSSGFAWTLHPGTNRLQVRPRNVAGREGIPSSIVLEYK
jgi:hypothetical protein